MTPAIGRWLPMIPHLRFRQLMLAAMRQDDARAGPWRG